jgi:hypothetical protein
MSSARTLRWESTADALRCGVEIADVVASRDCLENELDRALASLGSLRPAFLLVGFAGHPQEVAAAIATAAGLSFNERVFVAIDAQSLDAIDGMRHVNEKLGFVLDRVNARTPLSSLSVEFVDAVRFDDDFVQRACTDVRSACVLDAMVKLAHDLGLPTLASTPAWAPQFDFDYILRPAEQLSEVPTH